MPCTRSSPQSCAIVGARIRRELRWLITLARRRTASTNVELAAMLGVSRAESIANLTRRFGAWLATDANVREQLKCLDEQLNVSGASQIT